MDHPRRVSIGFVARGTIAVGIIAQGRIAIGAVAIGGVAVGLVSVGGIAVGLVAVGAASLGILAVGALALGAVPVGAVTWDLARDAAAHRPIVSRALPDSESPCRWLDPPAWTRVRIPYEPVPASAIYLPRKRPGGA